MRPEAAADLDVHSSVRSLSGWPDPARRIPASSSAERIARHAVSDDELTILQQALDRYDEIECIERGGQGVVYRARQKSTSRLVALKVLLDGPLATDRQRFRFEREIELVSRLRHPNIVTLYDSGVVRGRLFYAMEYVDGVPIDDYVVLKDLSPRSIVRLMVAVCRAIHFAHQNGVIHRDLKPVHIVLDDDGQPRVFDFGLAKDFLDDAADPRFSQTGLVMGTLPYLSPEQAGGGDGKADVRSDVYALGLILYELLTEESPYPVDGPPEQVRREIIGAEPRPLLKAVASFAAGRAPGLHEINRDLESVLNKALAKRKEDRYQSAAELGDDLERYLAGAAVTARAASRWYVLRKAIRRHRLAFGVAAAFGLTMVASTTAVSLAWSDARHQRDIAETQRDTARTALHGFSGVFGTAIDELEGSIRRLPGGYEVRERLIGKLELELPKLESFLSLDPALAELEATCLEKRADIDSGQGRRQQAAAGYAKFLDRAQRLVEHQGQSPINRLRVLVAQRKLADKTDDAEPLYARAVSYGQELAAAHPGDDDIRRELCQALVDYGSFIERSGDEPRAVGVLNQAFDLFPELPAADKKSDGWMRLRARAHAERGAAFLKVGSGNEGLEDLYTALRLRDAIATRNPVDSEARHDLLRAYYGTALAERDLGNIDAALRQYESAADVGRELVKLDPTATTWTRHRFQTHYELALQRLSRNEIDSARQHSAIARDLVAALLANDPHSANAREDVAFSAILDGRIELAGGDPESALQQFQRAHVLRTALVMGASENPRT